MRDLVHDHKPLYKGGKNEMVSEKNVHWYV
jgi:hypothetical protein